MTASLDDGWAIVDDIDGARTLRRRGSRDFPAVVFFRPGLPILLEAAGRVVGDDIPSHCIADAERRAAELRSAILGKPAVGKLAGEGGAGAGGAVERARAYLRALPASVQGQTGAVALFRAAVACVRGFALSDDHALELLGEYNRRARPPWAARELRRAVVRARIRSDIKQGSLLHARSEARRAS